MSHAPVRQPYDALVAPGNVSGVDRRYPYLNGGGRGQPILHDGVEYRTPYCLHGWDAQSRQPDFMKNSLRTFYGCRGFVKNHERADDWDCGYLEEGIVDVGVKGVQVLNPFWDSGPWPAPDNKEWYYRRGNVMSGITTPGSSPIKAPSSASGTPYSSPQSSPSRAR
ncbi:unnamed protein product [Peniophora sp. CBMAI 1063]|nr:unnamed protein product [Peniophora sp. CBMAI 1063]